MHAEVYRARPMSTRSSTAIRCTAPRSARRTPTLQFLTHDAVLFTDGLGIYDEGPALVTEASQGRAVAAALGPRRAALLRNHGVVIAGEDVRWAVLTAVTLERAIRFQSIAAHAGRRTAHPAGVRGRAATPEVPGPLPRRVLGRLGAPGRPGPRAAAGGRLTMRIDADPQRAGHGRRRGAPGAAARRAPRPARR